MSCEDDELKSCDVSSEKKLNDNSAININKNKMPTAPSHELLTGIVRDQNKVVTLL